MEKIVILGVSDAGVNFLNQNKKKYNVVAFIDNNSEFKDKLVNGVPVYTVAQLPKISFVRAYISQGELIPFYEEEFKKLKLPADKLCRDIPLLEQRKQQIIGNSLNNMLNNTFGYRKEEYIAKWEDIKHNYAAVRVFWMRVGTVGELIPRYWAAYDAELPSEPSEVLRVFLPIMESGLRICNKAVINLLRQKMYIPPEDEIPFWCYVMMHHYDEIDTSEIDKFMIRQPFPTYEIKPYQTEFTLSPREIACGRQKAEEMGLGGKFACLAARTATYNKKSMGHELDYAYRDMDFLTYKPTIAYLEQEGIATVKMGRDEKSVKIKNCVDYAGCYADESMDLYLAANAQFMISTFSGIVAITYLFGIPALLVNMTSVSFDAGAYRYTDKDLFIPKKFFSKPKNRFLTLLEIMEVENECFMMGGAFAAKGIEFIDNTPEEILAATQEFLARLRGTWEDTEEDKKNYARWQEIFAVMLKKARNNPKMWTGVACPRRLAATYLRNNAYLLE